ncbi:MAG: SusC/RagA family TonB-linked outer membrane protein, partial [Bacteroidales bacterium]|nr:SusC/RagA family TonB-linked outer membrane protein [Bacteroidales bacterium]
LAWTDAGEAKSRGIDGSLDFKSKLGKDFHIRTWANFTYAASEILVFEEPAYEGHSIYQQWGLIAERLFNDDLEAVNSPVQFGSYGAGDIKYLDINSDGSITTADMAPIGYPTLPEIIYGFGISAGYKNFDISCFFQGSARSSFWINAAATSPFDKGTNLLKAYADSHWSENNRDIYAMWPRLSTGISENNVPGAYYDLSGDLQWGAKHTWFMRNGSFLRLKSLEIGYTLPSKILKAIYLSNVRLYINGINLFCFSKFKLWDVEMAGEGLGYPIQRSYNAGITVSF